MTPSAAAPDTSADTAPDGARDSGAPAQRPVIPGTLEICSPVLALNARSLSALFRANITTVSGVARLSDAALLDVHGLTASSIPHIRARVAFYRASQRLAHEHYSRAGNRLSLVPNTTAEAPTTPITHLDTAPTGAATA